MGFWKWKVTSCPPPLEVGEQGYDANLPPPPVSVFFSALFLCFPPFYGMRLGVHIAIRGGLHQTHFNSNPIPNPSPTSGAAPLPPPWEVWRCFFGAFLFFYLFFIGCGLGHGYRSHSD